MPRVLVDIARAIVGSPFNTWATYLLGNVPGLPPIVQTVHILSVSAVMGSIVMIDLKVLGLALRTQRLSELVRRLMPWTWCALPFLAASGLVFVFARPMRYAVNPVFGLKFSMLLPALILTALFQIGISREPEFWERSLGRRVLGRVIAGISLALWVGVVLAGRWIAYADYLFPPE